MPILYVDCRHMYTNQKGASLIFLPLSYQPTYRTNDAEVKCHECMVATCLLYFSYVRPGLRSFIIMKHLWAYHISCWEVHILPHLRTFPLHQFHQSRPLGPTCSRSLPSGPSDLYTWEGGDFFRCNLIRGPETAKKNYCGASTPAHCCSIFIEPFPKAWGWKL